MLQLTAKYSAGEKEIESMTALIRTLENKNKDHQKEMETKDLQINHLNTELSDKATEVETYKTEKQTMSFQLVNDKRTKNSLFSVTILLLSQVDLKNASEIVAARNLAIEQLQKEYQELKSSSYFASFFS